MKASHLVAVAAVLSLLVSVACGGSAATSDAAAQTALAPMTVDVAAVKATAGTIEAALELSGNLVPRARVGLKPRVPGAIGEIYIPVAQGKPGPGELVIRTSGDPLAVLPAVKAAVLQAMPDVPLRFSETPASVERLPPRLGEHGREVLSEIGLSGD